MANRIQIPISFSYEVNYYVATTSGGSATQQVAMMLPAAASTITVTNRVTNQPAIVYSGSTGSTTISPVVTDAGGNVPGYLPEGSYNLSAAASGSFSGASVNWEAVYGAGVGNVASAAVDLAQLTAQVAAQLRSPVGSIIQYGGASDPVDSDGVTRWLIADGRSLSTTGTYASLYAVIGNTFGSGSGTFNIPDLRGKVPVGAGQGAGLTNRTLGSSSGEETHLLAAAEGSANGNVTSNTYNHSHGGNTNWMDRNNPHGHADTGHGHGASGTWNVYNNSAGSVVVNAGSGTWGLRLASGEPISVANGAANITNTDINHLHVIANDAHYHTLNARNADTAHNNMQPYVVVNHIIRCL